MSNYRTCPDWVWMSGVSGTAVKLYLCLKSFSRDKGECFPSRATLASVMGTSEKQISRLVAELESAGCIVVVRHGSGGLSSNLYAFPDEPAEGTNMSLPKDKNVPTLGTNMSLPPGQKCPTKEKTYKETNLKNPQATESKSNSEADAEAFVQAVKEIYPKGCKNPEWSRFARKAQTSLKSKPSRDKYLSAVRGYASTEPNHGYVKQPCSLIALVDDYVGLDKQVEPKEYTPVEIVDTWGEL